MLLQHSFVVIYVQHSFQWFNHSGTHITFTYIHGAFPLAPLAPLASSPLCPLPLTWLPPDVTGIVHLGPRLSVNCSLLFPIVPLCPPLQNPNPSSDFPEPNVHLIKARLNPLPSIPNSFTYRNS